MSKLGWMVDRPRLHFGRLAPWVLIGGGFAGMIAILMYQGPV